MARYRWDEIDWRIGRQKAEFTPEERFSRMEMAPEKIEFVGGIFVGDDERLLVLGMILERLGLDRVVDAFGSVDDWKAAVAQRGERERESR